ITPEQAFAELDSYNCPIIRGAHITSAQQLVQAVDRCVQRGDAGDLAPQPPQPPQPPRPVGRSAGEPPGQSMADECRRLSDMLYAVDGRPDAARRAMEALSTTKVPIINNCPLFRSVKARYTSGQLTAREAVDEMKANCPILSKELNPAMIFNFEEYGMRRDPHYDQGHPSHSHPQLAKRDAGCGCGCGASSPDGGQVHGKRLFTRDDEHDEPGMCPAGGKCECDHARSSAGHAGGKATGLERLLGGLFPRGNPATASLLATFYISLFPNLVLFATPTAIPARALRVMVGFAVGGLLGDVFLHLLPHMFAPEHDHGHGHGHSHDHVRNTVYGCAIFLGLMVFFAVDKFMRLFGSGHSHTHSHGHDHRAAKLSDSGSASEDETRHRLRKRRAAKTRRQARDASEADDEKDTSGSATAARGGARQIKLSAYLNLIADATHNFTDGLAMSASFYLSHAAGLSTFVAVFFHEIPHELGDFAILVQSGFSRTSALASQFFTALGAIAGTIAGILIEEASKGNSFNVAGLYTPGVPAFAPADPAAGRSLLASLFGGVLGLLPATVAGVAWSKLVIPFTAGGFIYVGTVSVLPDLLQPEDAGDADEVLPAKDLAATRRARQARVRRGVTMAVTELGAMLVGLGIMAAIAVSEGGDH
ncbi:hypothetical protein IWQ56_004739, partial [Coemansia nantahalensis]